MKIQDLNPRRFFLDTWRELDIAAHEHRQSSGGTSTSDTLLAVCIFSTVAVSLVLQGAYGENENFANIVSFIDDPASKQAHPILYSLVAWAAPAKGGLVAYLIKHDYYKLLEICYWAVWRIIGFLVIPLIAVLFYPKLRKGPLGWTFKGFFSHAWIYIALFLPVFAAVFTVSFFEEFNTYYPFYKNAHRTLFEFVIWESFYVAQFLSLEFFFRGFMLQPLRLSMGSSAIFAMTVPYVIIHIGKPVTECLAAVIAGIVLGTLAMKTRSIWGGFFIHVGVALSMDLLAIWQVH